MKRGKEINIIGTGHTKFGVLDKSIGQLMYEASLEALHEANINIDEVDVIYISNFSSSFTGQCHLPSVLASIFNKSLEAIRVESACASGSLAFKEAFLALSSGFYQTALVIGVEKMSETPIASSIKILSGAAGSHEITYGMTFPGLYALMAKRHFYEYGTSEVHLAEISVKNHKNALLNPLAHYHKEITIDDVLSSRVIASPLKLLDCSPISDGAAALVISIDKSYKPISRLIGIGHSTDTIELYKRKSLTSMPAVRNASVKAYEMAGISPDEIDIAEVHDCFTIAELLQIEDLGFCDKGEGGNLILNGTTQISGDKPVNISGGLKAKGHPIGATGVSQIVEITKQLIGDCKDRQINDVNLGLCCNVGGSGSSAVVTIFSR